MSKMLVATVSLMVTRDAMTILPKTVPAHEVEVMTAIFGPENIRELDEKPEPVELDTEVEAERLEQKYGQGVIRSLFGNNPAGKVAKAMAEHEAKPAKASKAAA